MSKDDNGRLFSKVAKFVRNPLKDWSDLDDPEGQGGSTDIGYSRQELREIIERRQRNDFVRRREFDMLRKLRQREAAGARGGSGTPSSFQVNSVGKTDGRALTLKKIDEIEQQMSQQWWKVRPSTDTTPADATSAPDRLSEQHARAYADTEPGTPPPRPQEPMSPGQAQGASRFVVETALDEAALRFARADDAGAESILVQAVADSEDDANWRALLDLYRATGDAEKFAALGTRYAQQFRRPAPEWVSLRALTHALQREAHAEAIDTDWYCPAQLERQGLADLTQALSNAGAVWRIDWRALRSIDAAAVAPLLTLFTHWGDSAVQLRFMGAERLIGVLAEATPLGDRSVDSTWWLLYLAVLRAMHLADDFEFVALNYCITFEVSPPAWQEARGQYAPLDVPKAGRLDELQVQVQGAPVGNATASPVQALLSGELTGASPAVWQRLDAEMAGGPSPTVSCAALVRVDFAAAEALRDWAAAHAAHGQRIELTDLHRLLVALFGIVGIAEHAVLTSRR